MDTDMAQDIKTDFNNINAYLLVNSVNTSKHPTSFVTFCSWLYFILICLQSAPLQSQIQ